MTQSVVHGIVLCAGLGLRLRPLTDGRPKPLLPFLDRPTARYGIDALLRAEVWNVGVNAHHHADRIDEFVTATEREVRASGIAQPRLTTVREPQLLGTGGGARNIWKALGEPNAPIVILNGDIVADFPLEALLKAHRRTGAVATLLVIPPLYGEAPIYLDPTGHWVAQVPSNGGEARSPLYPAAKAVTFGGVYVVEPGLLERVPAKQSCLIRDGIAPMIEAGSRIGVVEHDGFWADLGTPSRFFHATCSVLEDPTLLPHGPLPVRSDRIYVADARRVHPHAHLESPCYIAPGAIVEPGAVVGPRCVVGSGAVVRSNARITDCILMGNSQLSGTLSRRIICDGYSVRLP